MYPLHSYKEPTVFLMVLVYPLDVGNSHDRSVVLISGVCFTESLILVDVKEHIIKTLMCKVLAPHKLNVEPQNTLAVHTRISLITVLNMFFELVLCLTLFLFDVAISFNTSPLIALPIFFDNHDQGFTLIGAI